MLKIGITGGIGNGKSVVCEILRIHGIPVFDADIEAKKLNDSSPVIREKLTLLFGESLYQNNRLNRKKLAEIIFSDPKNLEKVNAIIHPELETRFAEWLNERKNQPFIAIDAALLFEAKFHLLVDKTVTIVSPKALRIERATRRDNVSRELIEARMKSQLPDHEKIALSDSILYNDNRHSLIQQVSEMLTHFIS